MSNEIYIKILKIIVIEAITLQVQATPLLYPLK